ncbi:hypothetical protein KR044_009773, partial [Drosophila immigrans]
TLCLFATLLVSAMCQNAEIAEQSFDITPDGSYNFNFRTSDGVNEQATGNGDRVRGSYSFTSPEGTPVEITYVADENGYQPQGDAIPVAPEVPAQIARALEYIAAHPPKE